MTTPFTRLESALVQELLDNNTLHSELERQLALNLLQERASHAALRARCIAWTRDFKTKLDAIPLEEVPDV